MYSMHGILFFFSSRRRHTRFDCDWSSDVCSSDLRMITDLQKRLMAIPGVHSVGSHIGQAFLGEEVVGVNFGENWIAVDPNADHDRSEERRVGKECRSRWSPDH